MAGQYSLETVVNALASSSVNGEWSSDAICRRWQQLVGRSLKWMTTESLAIVEFFATRPSVIAAADFLRGRPAVRKSYGRVKALRLVGWNSEPWTDSAIDEIRWDLPRLRDADDLADLLEVPTILLWQLADHRRFHRLPLCHYRFRWIPKRSGGARLIEAPKFRLRMVQRRLLDRLIARIPAHNNCHGFRRGRSIQSHAQNHVGRQVVVRFDLQDFFASVAGARIAAIFRVCGYSDQVVQLLTRICTSQMPNRVWNMVPSESERGVSFCTRDRLRGWHLPQGAPTSPALANLAAFRLDKRLSGLAACSLASYSRYADDLYFSGDERLSRNLRGLYDCVLEIAADEGFEINPRKTRRMKKSIRQHVCGLTVNSGVNSSRADFKRLRAILHNCSVHGPRSQNRDGHQDFRAHLLGQVEFHASVNPDRGERLKRQFLAIDWT